MYLDTVKETIWIKTLDNTDKTAFKTEKDVNFSILIQELNSIRLKEKMKTIWFHHIPD